MRNLILISFVSVSAFFVSIESNQEKRKNIFSEGKNKMGKIVVDKSYLTKLKQTEGLITGFPLEIAMNYRMAKNISEQDGSNMTIYIPKNQDLENHKECFIISFIPLDSDKCNDLIRSNNWKENLASVVVDSRGRASKIKQIVQNENEIVFEELYDQQGIKSSQDFLDRQMYCLSRHIKTSEGFHIARYSSSKKPINKQRDMWIKVIIDTTELVKIQSN